jgi:hypothetical protein
LQLLATSEENAWIRHAAGAARLIQLRGPKSYTTEFEKALFMAHAGTIVSNVVIRSCQIYLRKQKSINNGSSPMKLY